MVIFSICSSVSLALLTASARTAVELVIEAAVAARRASDQGTLVHWNIILHRANAGAFVRFEEVHLRFLKLRPIGLFAPAAASEENGAEDGFASKRTALEWIEFNRAKLHRCFALRVMEAHDDGGQIGCSRLDGPYEKDSDDKSSDKHCKVSFLL